MPLKQCVHAIVIAHTVSADRQEVNNDRLRCIKAACLAGWEDAIRAAADEVRNDDTRSDSSRAPKAQEYSTLSVRNQFVSLALL